MAVEGAVEVKESEALAQELLGTGEGAEEGDEAQDQEDQPGDTPLAEPGKEDIQGEAAAEQEEPEVGEDGKPIPKEAEPGEAQDSAVINEAVEYLNKVAGRNLSDGEAIEEMAKSTLKGNAKIQSLSEQLQEAVGYRQRYEALVSDPIISQVLQGKNPFTQAAQAEGLDEDVSPGVQKVINGLNQQIQTLTQNQQRMAGGMQNVDQMRVNAEVANYRKTIDAFATKPENADFKEMLGEYRDMQRINPYAPMPEKLKRMGAMMDNGVSIEEAWGVLNPGKVESHLKGKIAAAQKKKLGKGGIALRSKGKTPKVKDLSNAPLMETGEFMDQIVANIDAQEAGDE